LAATLARGGSNVVEGLKEACSIAANCFGCPRTPHRRGRPSSDLELGVTVPQRDPPDQFFAALAKSGEGRVLTLLMTVSFA